MKTFILIELHLRLCFRHGPDKSKIINKSNSINFGKDDVDITIYGLPCIFLC